MIQRSIARRGRGSDVFVPFEPRYVTAERLRLQIVLVNPLVLVDVVAADSWVGVEAIPARDAQLTEVAAVRPSARAWACFWAEIESFGVWRWPEYFPMPSGLRGEWRFAADRLGQHLLSSGAICSPEFQALRDGVVRLIGRPVPGVSSVAAAVTETTHRREGAHHDVTRNSLTLSADPSYARAVKANLRGGDT